MDNTTNDVVSKLKFIGKIKKGEKINVKSLFVQQDSLLTRLSRTFFNVDNRVNTYNFVDFTIKKSFELIGLYKSSAKITDQYLVGIIISDLKSSIEGIDNLKETYISDTMFCCKLDTLKQDVLSRLAECSDIAE